MMESTGVSMATLFRTSGETDAVQLIPEGNRVRLLNVMINQKADYAASALQITYIIFRNGTASSEILLQIPAHNDDPNGLVQLTLPGRGILFDNGIYLTCGTGLSPQGMYGLTVIYQGYKDVNADP